MILKSDSKELKQLLIERSNCHVLLFKKKRIRFFTVKATSKHAFRLADTFATLLKCIRSRKLAIDKWMV